MKLSGITATWLPIIVERMMDLVDEDLIERILNQAIERIEKAIERSENKWDDRIILPLLEIVKLAWTEEKKPCG